MASPSISLSTSGHDLEQRGLARAVETEHADLGAGEEAEGDVLEDLSLRRHDLADAIHGENVLSHSTGNPWERRRMQRKSVDYPRMRQYGLLQDPVACNVSMLLGTKKAPFWLPTLYFICL
jgi:hypothetical protein